MSAADFTRCIHELRAIRSWQLQRISPTTYGKDLGILSLGGMIRAGRCYRCKIGRGAWYYGVTPSMAVKDALKYMRQA